MPSIESLAIQVEKLIGSWERPNHKGKRRHDGRFPYPMERAILVLMGMNRGWTSTATARGHQPSQTIGVLQPLVAHTEVCIAAT